MKKQKSKEEKRKEKEKEFTNYFLNHKRPPAIKGFYLNYDLSG